MSFRDIAREWARDRRRSLSEDAAFNDLLQAFWAGDFEHRARPDGELESLVFTLEAPAGTSPDHPYSVTHDGHVLKKAVEQDTGRETYVATSERQALFWSRGEFLRFIGRFWEGNEPAATPLADFETADDACRFMAACSVDDYPPTPRALVERLHISRAALGSVPRAAFRRPAKRKPRPAAGAGSHVRRGAPAKSCWPWLEPLVLQWLDEEGEPHTRAEVERYMMRLLAERDEHVARSTLQTHAGRCITLHRQRRQADK